MRRTALIFFIRICFELIFRKLLLSVATVLNLSAKTQASTYAAQCENPIFVELLG